MSEQSGLILVKKLVEDFYNIKSIRIKRLQLGTININFLITARIGRFVLRFYRRNNQEKQIELEHKLISFLREKQFPVAGLIKTKFGRILGKSGGNFFALFEFIRGRHINCANRYQIQSAAEILGLYHSIVRDLNLRSRKRWWYIKSIPLEEYYKQIERLTILQLEPSLLILKSHIKAFKDNTHLYDFKKFPHLIIHGDFSLRNLKFIGNRVSGVFDFDNCRREIRVFDLVRPLQSLTHIGKEVNEKKIKLFFDYYLLSSHFPLSFLERKYLVEMLRIQHLKEALWQIRRYVISGEQINLRVLKKEIRFLSWLDRNYRLLKSVFETL